jgi:hypothetical protein
VKRSEINRERTRQRLRGHSLHECGFQENNFHKRDCLRFFFWLPTPASRDLTPTLVRFKAELTENLQTPSRRAFVLTP